MAKASLEKLIKVGLELKGTIDKSAKELDVIKDEIVAYAKEQMKEEQKSITLSEKTGKAKVKLDDSLSFITGTKSARVKELMKAGRLDFNAFFERQTQPKMRASAIKVALEKKGRAAKTLLKIVISKSKKPAVTFEAPNVEDLRK